MRHYVRQTVNLLLLLSAMLTALSGAGLGVRTPQVPVAVNSVVAIAGNARAVAIARTVRPVAALPRLVVVAVSPVVLVWQLAPAAPLYLGRRRE